MALHKKPAVALFMGCRDDSVGKQLASQAWRPGLTLWHPQVGCVHMIPMLERWRQAGACWMWNLTKEQPLACRHACTNHTRTCLFSISPGTITLPVYFPASGLSDKENNCLVMSQLPYNYVAHCFNSNTYHVTGRHLRGDLTKLCVYYICSHINSRFSVNTSTVNSSDGPLIRSEHR